MLITTMMHAQREDQPLNPKMEWIPAGTHKNPDGYFRLWLAGGDAMLFLSPENASALRATLADDPDLREWEQTQELAKHVQLETLNERDLAEYRQEKRMEEVQDLMVLDPREGSDTAYGTVGGDDAETENLLNSREYPGGF